MYSRLKIKRVATQFFLFLFASFLVAYGCGGGGGGDGDGDLAPAQIDSTTAPQIASGVGNIAASTMVVVSAIDLDIGSGLYCPKTLLRHVDRTWTVQTQGSGSYTEPCTDGGSLTINATWVGPDDAQDCSEMSNVHLEFVFSNCQEDSETLNGTMGFYVPGDSCTDTPSAFDISYTSFRYQNPLEGEDVTLNFTMGFSGLQYDTNDYLVGGTILIGGSFNDSSAGTSMNLTFDNWTFAFAEMEYDQFDELVAGTFTINGSLFGNIDGDQFSERYRNLVVQYKQTDTGEEFSVNGDYTGDCLDGWISIETIESLFWPDSGQCPTAGEVRIYGNGEATVECHGNGSLTIDVDGDTLPYASCDNLPTCKGGGEDDGDGSETEITWGLQSSTPVTSPTGLLQARIFHQPFTVTGSSGNVLITVTLKEGSGSILDEKTEEFYVEQGIEYELTIDADVIGTGLAASCDNDEIVISSPSASSPKENWIPCRVVSNNFERVGDYSITDMSVEERIYPMLTLTIDYTPSYYITGGGTVSDSLGRLVYEFIDMINPIHRWEGEYEYGTEVTLTATPDEGFVFAGWLLWAWEPEFDVDENHATLVITHDTRIGVSFTPR